MKFDMMSLAVGAIGGYFLAKKMADDKQAASDLGALHLGAIQMNPAHYGAIQMNPAHYGAIEMNPAHYGFHHNPKHLGALNMNPHGTYARSQEGAFAAKAPWGYGALHLGALAQQG